MQLSAHAQNHASPERCRKSLTMIFLDPHFEEVRGGVESWWMARWKARAEFLLSVIELLFLSLMVEVLQVKIRCLQEWEPKFQGEGVILGNIFWFLQN